MIGFGVLGFTLRKLKIPAVPVILGILLGGHMEVSLRRAMVLSMVTGPIYLILIFR